MSPTHHFPPSDLSTAGVIDWDAFQNLMMFDNHGFGELLAAGPETAWGYLGNWTGIAGVPGLSSLADRSGYAGPPTTAEEDRVRAERAGEGRNIRQPNVKTEEWGSG